jgi:hypothetical protein
MQEPTMDPDDSIQRAMNEQKKRALEDRYGARFSGSPNGLSSDAEGAWLDYISEFERQYAENGQITVREFVGNPDVRPLTEIPPDEISAAVNMLMELLEENNIDVHFNREVSDAEVYRFVTEELFREKMDNIRIEEMMHTFVYDEFHPDEASNARREAERFLNALFYRDRGMIWQMLYKQGLCDFNGKKGSADRFMFMLNDWYVEIESFTSHLMEFTSCDVEIPHATVTASLTWAGIGAKTKEPVGGSGTASVRFMFSPVCGWDVIGVTVPGCERGSVIDLATDQ